MGGAIHPQGNNKKGGKMKEGWKDRGMEEWGHVCGHLSAYSCASGSYSTYLLSISYIFFTFKVSNT